MKLIVNEVQHRGRKSAKQALGARRDSLEYRLHIGGRGGDHLQDFGRGGLPLQCLGCLAEQPLILVARQRQFAAQPRILQLKFDLARLRLIAFGARGFEARLHFGDG